LCRLKNIRNFEDKSLDDPAFAIVAIDYHYPVIMLRMYDYTSDISAVRVYLLGLLIFGST
jgi:hypothetical protein